MCYNKRVCAVCYHLDVVRASQDEDVFRVTVRQNGEVCVLPKVFHLHGSLRRQRLNSVVISEICSCMKKCLISASQIKIQCTRISLSPET